MSTNYTYEPFGNTTTQGSANANPFQFTGRENDGDGLYFYRARYYNPMFGRFISEDPAGFAGGINEHAYVGDDPVGNTDPGGLYTSYWHRYITEQAAREAGLSPEAAQELADAVAAVDSRPGTQGTDAQDTNTHAMSGRKPNGNQQSCKEAYTATQLQLLNDLATHDIAKGLHTIQDATAPAHRGYQPWYGPLSYSYHHYHTDRYPDPADVDEAIRSSAQYLRDALNNGWEDPSAYLPSHPCPGQ